MKIIFLLITILSSTFSYSQIDTSLIIKLKSLDTANTLKTDTAAVPNDGLTRKIKELRSSKHGFSIETIIGIKLKEEQEKDTTHSKVFYDRLQEELTTGKTGKLLENALVNLYRNNFTEPEIDELIRFYKTSAGKKMDTGFIILLVQSAKDAEQLMKIAAKRIEAEEKK